MFRLILLLAICAFAEEHRAPLSAPGGRFVFGQTSEFRRDQFMLDTQTGRLWQIVMSRDSLLSLQGIPYESLEIKNGEVYKVVSEIPQKPEMASIPIEKPAARIAVPPSDMLPAAK